VQTLNTAQSINQPLYASQEVLYDVATYKVTDISQMVQDKDMVLMAANSKSS